MRFMSFTIGIAIVVNVFTEYIVNLQATDLCNNRNVYPVEIKY